MLAGAAANDPLIERDSHNVAPALSNDGTTLYVVVKWATNARYCYLLGLNSTTLQTKFSVFLRDPRTGDPAGVPEDSTASPMVAPDGDVYFGVLGTPANNGSRGFLLRFSGDLSVTKTPGGFGWDYTAGIVPASAVPSYTGRIVLLAVLQVQRLSVSGRQRNKSELRCSIPTARKSIHTRHRRGWLKCGKCSR